MENRGFIRNLALFAMIAGVIGISAVGATGPKGEDGERPEFDSERRAQMQEHKEAMKEVLEAGDYNAFVELVGDKKLGETITADNFDQFVEMHNLKEAGDREGAKAIADELGLKHRPGQKKFLRHAGKTIKGGEFLDVDGDGVCTFEENKPAQE